MIPSSRFYPLSWLLLALATSFVPTRAAVPDARLALAGEAMEAAERGDFDAARYAGLAGHPLYGWIEYAALRRDIDSLPVADGTDFLARYRGQAVADAFREIWLAALARRQDWTAFMAAWAPSVDASTLRCIQLEARRQLGNADAQWVRDAQALWLTGDSLPGECDAPFAALAAQGGLPPALRWQRLDLAAADGNAGVMRAAANGMPEADATLANAYAAFVARPTADAAGWPKTDRSREVASYGLARLARSDPDAAEALLPPIADALALDATQRGRVRYQVALWTAASYLPGAAQRLAAVPDAAYDERLHEWQVREALARSDWKAALAAIRRMPASQRADSHWQYFEARLAELTGDREAARALYRQAATRPDYHGFLAADRIDQPYALCPWLPDDGDAAKAAVAQDPALVRAVDLYRLDRKAWAVREWNDALSRFDDTRRRLAVEVAQDNGWFDRAVFALGKQDGQPRPEELRLYKLRFPLHHEATIRREAARNGLDPAWVAAEIRAESVFDPSARSPANARGLMQVLPTTGAGVARRLGLPWGGAESLYDADTNIVLGTAYLRQLLDRDGGKPYFAIAGYNAGPDPLARWQAQRPGMDPDFWIETISYGETRDYVARVLAFSVIYDWRLNGRAVPLSDRMRGRLEAPRKAFACPLAAPPAA